MRFIPPLALLMGAVLAPSCDSAGPFTPKPDAGRADASPAEPDAAEPSNPDANPDATPPAVADAAPDAAEPPAPDAAPPPIADAAPDAAEPPLPDATRPPATDAAESPFPDAAPPDAMIPDTAAPDAAEPPVPDMGALPSGPGLRSPTARPGEAVALALWLPSPAEAMALEATVRFPTPGLSFGGATVGDDLGAIGGIVEAGEGDGGVFALIALDPALIPFEDADGDGDVEIVVLHFTVSAGAEPGRLDVTLEDVLLSDRQGDRVDLPLVNGVVLVVP